MLLSKFCKADPIVFTRGVKSGNILSVFVLCMSVAKTLPGNTAGGPVFAVKMAYFTPLSFLYL